ncbi:MAG: galactose mutarotase [Oscillospiraceae bacterium]|jgi:aldose 1-epimerase|nr:galactose mutarotase [Oscillospiraceae bacterium]
MIRQENFGVLPDGRPVQLWRIEAPGGRYAELLTYGATLQTVVVPDKNGDLADVVQGFDTLEGHLLHSDYQGQTVGRYANRISGGFRLGGEFYAVPADANAVFLHGGGEFSHTLWDAELVDEQTVALSYASPDGSYGFPGNVSAVVRYSFDGNTLTIDYFAETDKSTVLNLTNHTYWNLSGNGNILDHILQADAKFYQPVDWRLLPDGVFCSVDGTPFDFRAPKAIGCDIDVSDAQLHIARGYDHHFCLDEGGVVRINDPKSDRTLTMATDMPGFQLYTGNFLSGKPGKGGRALAMHSGFCLETQFPPDTPNSASAADCVFAPERPYRSRTVYSFGTE